MKPLIHSFIVPVCGTDDDIALNMSSSTSDLSLFSSFEKDSASADPQTSLALHTATSNPSGTTASTAVPSPGYNIAVVIDKIEIFHILLFCLMISSVVFAYYFFLLHQNIQMLSMLQLWS